MCSKAVEKKKVTLQEPVGGGSKHMNVLLPVQVFRLIGCAQQPSSTGHGRNSSMGLAAEVAAQSPPLDEWRKFIYCHAMTGEVLGEVDHFKGVHVCVCMGGRPTRLAVVWVGRRFRRMVNSKGGHAIACWVSKTGRNALLMCTLPFNRAVPP